jgi:hypothetical protein
MNILNYIFIYPNMAFIRNSRSFTSEQFDAVNSIAKAFSATEKKSDSKTTEVYDAYRTRPCSFGTNCNRGESCNYANDSTKLVPIRCKFDSKCFNRGSCIRFHTGQTMDEYITLNNFKWPSKKFQVEDDVSSVSKSFVTQMEESEEDLIKMDNEINEVCAEILYESQKRELWAEMVEENRRLGQTESDDEFNNFVEYCEAVSVYQKTLQKLHDESEYAQYQYSQFSQGSEQ